MHLLSIKEVSPNDYLDMHWSSYTTSDLVLDFHFNSYVELMTLINVNNYYKSLKVLNP